MLTKRKFLIALAILLLIFVCVVLFISVRLFLAGQPVDASSLYFDAISISDHSLSVDAQIVGESAVACKNYHLEKTGTSVYLTIYGVLVSRFYDSGSVTINEKGDFRDVKEIYLVNADGTKTRVY